MITQNEIDDIFITTLKSISQNCERITSGNVSHNIATIKGKCREMMQFYHEFPVSSWHSVADGDLPKESKGDLFNLTLLICMPNGRMFPAYYDIKENTFADEFNEVIEIAYWMEIPKLPTK